MIPTVNVTVLAFDPTTNAPLVAAPVTARLTAQDTYQQQIVARDTISGVTDNAGSCILPLFPNELGEVLDGQRNHTAYAFVVKHPTLNRAVYKTVASVPNRNVNLLDIAGNVIASTIPTPGTGGQRKDAIVPAGLINGVNTLFTLPTPANPLLSLQLYMNGLFQTPGIDYVLYADGVTIGMLFAPQVGDKLIAYYRA